MPESVSRFVSRSGGDYAHALMAKLPRGAVWPRDQTSTLYRLMRGLAEVWARWQADVAALIVEAFPPTSDRLLTDWERVLGLPEPCLPVTDLTVSERQLQVREKLARRPGRQDRAYFYELALRLGYDITITEHVPAQAGLMPAGYYRREEDGGRYVVRGAGCGSPHIRYVWTIRVTGPRLTWFQAGPGGGRAGRDPLLRIRRADDLECVLNQHKPAHTKLIFDYLGV